MLEYSRTTPHKNWPSVDGDHPYGGPARALIAARIIDVTAIIETSGLVMQFPNTRALDGLDISIPPGVTGLVGANGAGKTTLISLTLGLLKPTSGSINVLGLDPNVHGPALRAQIGYGPERNVLPDDLRAYDFVRHLAEVKGLPATRPARVQAIRCTWSAWVKSGSGRSAPCRPANANASSLLRQSLPTRALSCSTNQPTASTPCSATRC